MAKCKEMANLVEILGPKSQRMRIKAAVDLVENIGSEKRNQNDTAFNGAKDDDYASTARKSFFYEVQSGRIWREL